MFVLIFLGILALVGFLAWLFVQVMVFTLMVTLVFAYGGSFLFFYTLLGEARLPLVILCSLVTGSAALVWLGRRAD